MEYQNQIEFFMLLDEFKKIEPKNILEVGSLLGETFKLWVKYSAEGAKICSVDYPVIPQDNRYGAQRMFHNTLHKMWGADYKRTTNVIVGDSHSKNTLDKVMQWFDRELDFLFIDGDHTYNGVKMDFQMYGPLVRKGGIIAFHDICSSPTSFTKVNEFWSEIKSGYEYKEIVEDWNQGQYGIGVLYV